MPTKRKFSGRGGGGKRAKTAFRGRRSTSRKLANLRNNKFTKKIKSTILKMSEPKHYITPVAKVELYHNGGSSGDYKGFRLNTNGPAIGTSETQRVGDRYFRTGWKVNLLLGQKFDRPNVTWRILVLRCGVGMDSYLFSTIHETGGSGNLLLDTLNKDRYTVMYQKTIHKNWNPTVPQGAYTEAAGTGTSTTGGKELTWAHKFWVPCKREVKTLSDGSQSLSEPYVYFVAIACYDAYGTLPTDNIAYFQGNVKEYFRDP